MRDLRIVIEDKVGALAKMGEILGKSGISIEGGGALVFDRVGIAHFLFEDGEVAQKILTSAGFQVLGIREVLTVRLKQDVPGQLGLITKKMADAGVNIDALYSDHNNQLVLVVDNVSVATEIVEKWIQEFV